SKVENKAKTDYTIDHSAGMYVFDKEGKIRLYLDYGQKPADIASDLKKLM
ncbi:MAG: SCO family protein, partial [Methylotenera sp.]